MQIRAENDPRYSRRFLIMGICAIGFALYCLYDGFVGYPGKRERGFEEFKADYKSAFKDANSRAMNLDEFETLPAADERRKSWETYLHERDIPSGPDVVMQFIMATATAGVGLLLLSIPIRARGRWIEATDSGLTSSWGESFNFDQVALVNKRKWRDKGIAKVVYRDGNRKRRFVIDDYKFDRYPTDAILYELEQKIDLEKIVNGPPEPQPEVNGEADAGADSP